MTKMENTIAPLCQRGYACREAHTYCRPAFPIDKDNFYFVGQGNENEDCLYKKKYGSLHTCDCPVRLEIYQRYKI